ncbi:MAG TPA: polysaccharide deacetylase family protein [Bacteroidia bacterium]|nr:polysaccharide deacetylase family protein [Bacteroidia bacterium]
MNPPDLSKLFLNNCSATPEIIVYTEFLSNRLVYTLDFLIKNVWQKNYILTNEISEFQNSDKLKINYSSKYLENAINIYPSQFLFSKGIDKHYQPNFDSPLSTHYSEDIFSVIFYHISRYEEWQKNFSPDIHQRFEAQSGQFYSQIHSPFLDEQIFLFKSFIKNQFPSFETNYFYKEIFTFDLDNILAFKGKSAFRSIGALLKHLLKGELILLKERINVLSNKKNDPFEEVYSFIENLSQNTPIIFFVLCRSNTKFDRAAELSSKEVTRVIKQLSTFAHIGLHPSYYSMCSQEIIQSEKKLLENIIDKKIISSRQHYLRTDIATTPKLLLSIGIQYDFTMGFASSAGFRSGTTFPFYYYDFEKERATNLLMIPFSVMDGAYFNYQKTDITAAIKNIENIREKIKSLGGYFIPLFHEITLCPLFNNDAVEWRKVFTTPSLNTI